MSMPRKSSRHPEMKALIVCFWALVNKIQAFNTIQVTLAACDALQAELF